MALRRDDQQVDRGSLLDALRGVREAAPAIPTHTPARFKAAQPTRRELVETLGLPDPTVVPDPKSPGGLFGAVLQGLDFGRAAITSTIKEGIDLVQGEGFDASEWWDQATTHYGFGDLIHDERDAVGWGLVALSPFTAGVSAGLGAAVLADNIWADRIVGFIGDVAVDPWTYMGGFGAVMRGVGWKGAVKALDQVATKSADDLVRMGVAQSKDEAAAMIGAANEAITAAQKGRSLSSAARSLGKTDAGRKVSSELGFAPGVRFRLPGTGPVGRFMRQDRYLDRMVPGLDIGARQARQIPKFYQRSLADAGIDPVDAVRRFRSGKGRSAAAAELSKTLDDDLVRVIGQAARSPVEAVLPGLPSLRGAARVALGANLVARVTDAPIQAARKLTPQSVQEHLATMFNPTRFNTLIESSNPRHVALGVNLEDFMRFGRGKENFFSRGVENATEDATRRGVSSKVSDRSMFDLLENPELLVRGADGELLDEVYRGTHQLKMDGKWFDNLPEDVRNLAVEDPEALFYLARDLDRWVQTSTNHVTDAYGVFDAGAGRKVWSQAEDVARKEGRPWRGARRMREDARRRVHQALNADDVRVRTRDGRGNLIDPDHYDPKLKTGGHKSGLPWEATGRFEPASLKNRMYQPGKNVVLTDIDGNIGGIHTTKDGVHMLTEVDGKPFVIRNVDEVGKSVRRQIDEAYARSFGESMFEDEFSVMAEAWKRGMGRDVRIEYFMQRIRDVYPVEKFDDVMGDIEQALDDFHRVEQALKGKGRHLRRMEGRVRDRRARAATWAAGAYSRTETIMEQGGLSQQFAAARRSVAEIDDLLSEQRAELADMYARLEAGGVTLRELTETIERVGKFDAEVAAKYEAAINDAVAAGARVGEIQQARQATDELRDGYEQIMRSELGDVQQPLVDALKTAELEYRQAAKDFRADMKRFLELTAEIEALDAQMLERAPRLTESIHEAGRAAAAAREAASESRVRGLTDVEIDTRPEVLEARLRLSDGERLVASMERNMESTEQAVANAREVAEKVRDKLRETPAGALLKSHKQADKALADLKTGIAALRRRIKPLDKEWKSTVSLPKGKDIPAGVSKKRREAFAEQQKVWEKRVRQRRKEMQAQRDEQVLRGPTAEEQAAEARRAKREAKARSEFSKATSAHRRREAEWRAAVQKYQAKSFAGVLSKKDRAAHRRLLKEIAEGRAAYEKLRARHERAYPPERGEVQPLPEDHPLAPSGAEQARRAKAKTDALKRDEEEIARFAKERKSLENEVKTLFEAEAAALRRERLLDEGILKRERAHRQYLVDELKKVDEYLRRTEPTTERIAANIEQRQAERRGLLAELDEVAESSISVQGRLKKAQDKYTAVTRKLADLRKAKDVTLDEARVDLARSGEYPPVFELTKTESARLAKKRVDLTAKLAAANAELKEAQAAAELIEEFLEKQARWLESVDSMAGYAYLLSRTQALVDVRVGELEQARLLASQRGRPIRLAGETTLGLPDNAELVGVSANGQRGLVRVRLGDTRLVADVKPGLTPSGPVPDPITTPKPPGRPLVRLEKLTKRQLFDLRDETSERIKAALNEPVPEDRPGGLTATIPEFGVTPLQAHNMLDELRGLKPKTGKDRMVSTLRKVLGGTSEGIRYTGTLDLPTTGAPPSATRRLLPEFPMGPKEAPLMEHEISGRERFVYLRVAKGGEPLPDEFGPALRRHQEARARAAAQGTVDQEKLDRELRKGIITPLEHSALSEVVVPPRPARDVPGRGGVADHTERAAESPLETWRIVDVAKDLKSEELQGQLLNRFSGVRNGLRERGWHFYDDHEPLSVGERSRLLKNEKDAVAGEQDALRAMRNEREAYLEDLEQAKAGQVWNPETRRYESVYFKRNETAEAHHTRVGNLKSPAEAVDHFERLIAQYDAEIPLQELRIRAAEDKLDRARLALSTPTEQARELEDVAQLARQRWRDLVSEERLDRAKLRALTDELTEEPTPPPNVFADVDELRQAYLLNVEGLREQVRQVQEVLPILAQAAKGVAGGTKQVRALKDLVRLLSEGLPGTGALTPPGRFGAWGRHLQVFSDMDGILKHEAFTAGASRMTGSELIQAEKRAAGFAQKVQEFADDMGFDTTRVPQGGYRRLELAPLGIRDGESMLGELHAVQEVVAEGQRLFNEQQQAILRRNQARVKLDREKRLLGEALTQRDKRLAEALDLEIQAREFEMGELAAYMDDARAAASRVSDIQQRVEGVVESLAERRARVGSAADQVVGEEPLSDVLRRRVDLGGYEPDAFSPDTLFSLKAAERETAAELLKDSFSKAEWGPWRLASGDAALDSEMMAVVDAFARINDKEAVGKFWGAWDKFQTWLKASMIATPGFVNRNIFGAFFNAWLDGVNLTEIARSGQFTLRVAREMHQARVPFVEAAQRLAAKDQSLQGYVDLLRVGVRGGGQAVDAVELELGLRNARSLEILFGGRIAKGGAQTSISVKPWSPRFVPFQAVRSANSWVEDIVRLGVGMDTMRWGGTVDDALNRIAKTQFDYDELTSWERDWAKRFIPFYTWTRKNLPYQLKQLGMHPGKYNRLLAAKRNLELGTEDEGVVPDYYLEPFGVRLPFAFRGATVYTAPDIPFQDLGRYFGKDGASGAAKALLSGASPIIKAPLETYFGKQVFTGVPFTGRYQQAPNPITKVAPVMHALSAMGWAKKNQLGEWRMRDHHIYIVNSMLPTVGLIRRLFPNEEKYQRNQIRNLLSVLGGVSANFNTPQAQSNWLLNQRYEQLDDRQDFKDLVLRAK